jgi:hypothetical protein
MDELAHIPPPKTKRRLEADLLDCIERGKILRRVKTVKHSPTLAHFLRASHCLRKAKSHPLDEDGFPRTVERPET